MKIFILLVVFMLWRAPVKAQLSNQVVKSEEWRGPLPLQNERPLQAIFLHLPVESPDVLPRGVRRFGMQVDIANNLLLPTIGPNGEIVAEDFETQRLKFTWRRGLGRDLEMGIGTNLTARNGGLFDSPIEWYHRLLGLDGNGPDNPQGRDNVPRGRSILMFQNASGQSVNQGSAFGPGDTTIWLKKQLTRGHFSSAARLALKVPTGSERKILGSGGWDGGLAIDARYQFARNWALFGSAGATKFGNSAIPGARDSGLQGGLGFEWRVGKRASVIAQMDAAKRVVTTGNAFADRTPIIGSIGFKKQLSAQRAYWFSISENGDYHKYNAPFFGNLAPDFTLSFGYEWHK